MAPGRALHAAGAAAPVDGQGGLRVEHAGGEGEDVLADGVPVVAGVGDARPEVRLARQLVRLLVGVDHRLVVVQRRREQAVVEGERRDRAELGELLAQQRRVHVEEVDGVLNVGVVRIQEPIDLAVRILAHLVD